MCYLSSWTSSPSVLPPPPPTRPDAETRQLPDALRPSGQLRQRRESGGPMRTGGPEPSGAGSTAENPVAWRHPEEHGLDHSLGNLKRDKKNQLGL